MKAVLFAGGVAGRKALELLASAYPSVLAAIVWDAATGEIPDCQGVPSVSEENCPDGVEVALCSGYGRIIPEALLSNFSFGSYNAHPSLLPSYRGRHAIQWAIAEGESEFGVSIHRITSDIDAGGVVMAERRKFGIESNISTISQSLADLGAEMIVRLVEKLLNGEKLETVVPPDPMSRYWRKREPSDSRIPWERPSKDILNLLRACTSAYPSFAARGDGTQVRFSNYLASNRPGTVLFSSPEGCLVATLDSVVWLVPDRPLEVGEILE